MWDLSTASSNRYVFSEWIDTFAFTLPIIVSVLISPFLFLFVDSEAIPLLGYFFVVVLMDVAHVWTTLFRTHFDSIENSRRSFLYNKMPFVLFVCQSIFHYFAGERLFWTLVGYLAIYHFVKQQYGFLMVAQCREKNFKYISRDKLILYTFALLPIGLWHCDNTRHFDWFNREDAFLLSSLPQLMSDTVLVSIGQLSVTPLRLGYFAWALHWLYFLYRMRADYRECVADRRPFPVIRSMLLFYAGLTWSVGILVNHKMIALTFLNLFHAIPSFFIVFCASMNRWHHGLAVKKITFRDWIGRFFTKNRRSFLRYASFLFVLGIFEEILWEFFVWHDYIDTEWTWGWSPDEGAGYFHPILYSSTVSLLILPQTVHYVLDMYIWKMGTDQANPGLKLFLGLSNKPMSPLSGN